MANKPIPGIIFSMEFFTLDGVEPRPWKAGENTFLDYIARPETFDQSKHLHDEYRDFMDYMSNEEKSDGLFDLGNDHLSFEQIEEYRALEIPSWKQDCPKYVGVMSFTNEFLKEVGALTENGFNTKRLKEVARSGMSEMIHASGLKKLQKNPFKEYSSQLSTPERRPTEKEKYFSNFLAEKAKRPYSSSKRLRRPFRTAGQRKDYLQGKQQLSHTVETELRKLSSEYEHHVDSLMHEFEYEQNLQIQRSNY